MAPNGVPKTNQVSDNLIVLLKSLELKTYPDSYRGRLHSNSIPEAEVFMVAFLSLSCDTHSLMIFEITFSCCFLPHPSLPFLVLRQSEFPVSVPVVT